jgi:hypothetical protein
LVANLPPVWNDGKRRYPKARKTVSANGLRRAERALADWLEELERASSIYAKRLTIKDLSDRYLEHTDAVATTARIYLHVSDEANDAATATQEVRIAAAIAKVAGDSPSVRPDPVSLATRRKRNTSK